MRGAIRYTLRREPGDEEIDLSLEFDYSPGRAAVMYLRNGDPGYPEEPAECELLHAYRSNGSGGWVDFIDSMTEREIENAELYILENWE